MEVEALVPTFLMAWAVAATVMFVMWVRQLRTRNATSVDVAWAANLGLLAILAAIFLNGFGPRRALMASMVALASFRLAAHLASDRLRHSGEDGRYAAIRAEKGDRAPIWFFFFYQAQGLLDAVLAIPFILVARDSHGAWRMLDWAAVAVWSVAVIGEALSDNQLARWKRDPRNKGRTCRAGLWAYSRHPNYFFEWLTWIAYGLLATSTPMGWLGWVPAALMLFFILKVTGIPPTEAQALKSRPDYARYQTEVSAFFPWFPAKAKT